MFATFAPAVHADTALTYDYDANGNLIRGDGKYYEYNDANKLVKVRHGDQSGPVIAEYFYDYNGQRIKKVENGVTTYYIGKHTVTDVSESGTTSTKYYYANNERVAQKNNSGNLTFYHFDHLGGTNAVTDSSGNLVERTKYYPFGEIRLGGNERFTFTGKEMDEVTDQYYFEARYYNPEFKHFTQADTVYPNLYDPQDLNRYAYVRNNPIKLVDPSGRFFGNFIDKLTDRAIDKAVNYASNTKVGNFLGDVTLKIISGKSSADINALPPEAQAQYYGELAGIIDHAYEVNREASKKSLSGVWKLFKGDIPGALLKTYELDMILAEETGYVPEKYIKLMKSLGDAMGVYLDAEDLSKFLTGQKKGDLKKIYKLFKGGDSLDDKVRDNWKRYHRK